MKLVAFYLFCGEIEHLKVSLAQTQKVCDDVYIFSNKQNIKILKNNSFFDSCNIFEIDWKQDFSSARNISLDIIHKNTELTNSDWIVYIDSDECFDAKTVWKLDSIISMYATPSVCAFSVPIVNNGKVWFSEDLSIQTTNKRELQDRSVRIFRASMGYMFKGRCRETIDINPNLVFPIDDIVIYHHAYRYSEETHRLLNNRQIKFVSWSQMSSLQKEKAIGEELEILRYISDTDDIVLINKNKHRPKVGFFALHFDPPLGGAERSMSDYFNLLKEDYQITVFCFLNSDGKRFQSKEVIERNGFTVVQSPLPIDRTANDFIREQSPDIIATQLLGSDIVIDLAKRNNIPCVYFVHGLFEDVCQHYLLDSCPHNDLSTCPLSNTCPNAATIARHYITYLACSKIVCNSEYTKNILTRFFPNIDNKISVINPYIDTNIFDYGRREKGYRSKKKVMAVNSMPAKGRNVVINLALVNQDIDFIYVDSKPEDEKDLSLSRNIKLYGKVSKEEMSSLYLESDLVICPTLMNETFGCVPCESILCGTPVLCSNKGYLPNIVKDGKTGYSIDGYDHEKWEEYLNKSLNMSIDEDEIKKLKNSVDCNDNSNKIKNIFNSILPQKNTTDTFISNKDLQTIEYIQPQGVEMVRSDKKKILFLARFFMPPLGGGEYFNLAVLRYLKENGYDCSAACYADPATEQFFTSKNILDWHGIPVDQIIVRSHSDILAHLRTKNPDVLITQSFDAPSIIAAAKSLEIKTIFGVHFWRNICSVEDNFVNMLNRPLSSMVLLKDYHGIFTESDAVYVNSDFMKLAVKRLVGVDIDRIIYPITDTNRIVSKSKQPKYVTMVNPDIGKGGKILIHLARLMPDIPFLCVGRAGEIIPDNILINKALTQVPNIKIIEKTDDMSSVYGQTKVMICPSLVDETFSMVSLEAMCNGIPVLASPNGNFPYLIQGGGMLLDPANVSLWAEAINCLFSDLSFYRQMSEEALMISKKYQPEIELKKYKQMVDSLLGE